jgi:ABC-type multidrug transport system fused ATPase/permease subunit
MIMSLMDLAGVALVGVLGALAVNGIESKKQGTTVTSVLKLIGIQGQALQFQALVLGLMAALVLIARTILSIIFTKRTLFFLSRRGARISGDLISKVLSQPMLKIQEKTTQEILYAVTNGVSTITLGVLSVLVSLVADGTLLIAMALGLFVVDPIIALSTLIVFGLIGLFLYKYMHSRAAKLGVRNSELTIEGNEKILEVLNSYRESVVRNRRQYYATEIARLRMELAETLAELAFMPNVSKYVIEGTIVIGSLAVAGVQFALKDATHAIGTLTIFIAAGSRIAPAVLRVQQGAISIKSSLGAANPTLDLIEDLNELPKVQKSNDSLDTDHRGFIPEVSIEKLRITYPGKSDSALREVSLTIAAGTSVAFVGPSGAGKTTLVDSILGILKPDDGTISISGLSPLETINKWPGAIAYVPQDVSISNGTFRENVALGYPRDQAHEPLVRDSLAKASLLDFVLALPLGLDTPVGERGTKISGGQRQRLGIARALFTQPRLLVLDEATSALDGETELDISNAINALKGATTVILIAHRLSTVRNADTVYYLENGLIRASGTFEEVRFKVPDFDNQAKLMGL